MNNIPKFVDQITPEDKRVMDNLPTELSEEEKLEALNGIDELIASQKEAMSKFEKLELLKDSVIKEIIFENGKMTKIIVVKDCLQYELKFTGGTPVIMDGITL